MRIAVSILLLGLLVPFALSAEPAVHVIQIDGAIGPVAARYVSREIERAEEGGAECLIVKMDTPGGLDSSMRTMIQAILASQVPVVLYVSPAGGRCASAGVFIAMAADVVAMTPGTSIGAAHPVTIGEGEVDEDTMDKIVNDSATYMRGLAEQKGRNAEWAEKAVRESATATAEEALELGVIDMVVESVDELVARLDGWDVGEDRGGSLETAGAAIKDIDMGARYRLLDLLSNPNVAYMLLILGFYGVFFELSNPGSIFPGVVGAIFLILAFFSFQMLPINYAGVLLILLALVLFIAEIKITSGGMLTVGGTISMFLGSLMLIESPAPFLRISYKVIIPAVITTALFFIFAVGAGMRAQRRKPTTGREGLVGMRGVTTTDVDPSGQAFIRGELWSVEADGRIEKGEVVEVVSMDGLVVRIRRAGSRDEPPGRD
ncbi:MAG: nodulation protein NfeD [bacterium]|jgi:membrane-bound serine protease (ClpP class)